MLFCGLFLLTTVGINAQSKSGQSTEGDDFWVTFLQADQKTSKSGEIGNYNKLYLQLSISAREDCEVTIENPFTDYTETVQVSAGVVKLVPLYEGHPVTTNARSEMATSGKVCYAVNNETVDTCALHVKVKDGKKISLFAANYKKATFDATNVLPTSSLLKEYMIQSYTPSDHDGNGQGTHFAVIATENNTQVVYRPTVLTPKNSGYRTYLNNKDNPWSDPDQLALDSIKWAGFVIGEHTDTVVLQKGQVYYVWTGDGEGEDYDLSGTYVKADKPIAVFQGSPHTNIPYEVEQRDHIVSQAMPIQYWGNTFALTASKSRPSDIIRIMALNDETVVRINGDSVYTFDFSTNPKHYWEVEIGAQGKYAKDGSCMLTTSCPCAVHLFIVSQKYHGDNKGDPAMLWINPIEQQIDQVTFNTYASRNGTTSHYVNIVTDQPELITLGDTAITADFQPVSGSGTYYYAQKSLGSATASHTLKSNGSGFIAHVYGFTNNESYGYSAGGATKPLTQQITITDGDTTYVFTPDSENKLCGMDTIKFACHPDYDYEKIEWYFGDGQSDLTNTDSVPHFYPISGNYEAQVLIYRYSTNLCAGQSAVDTIPITVTIGRQTFSIDTMEVPCPKPGETMTERIGYIYYSNPGHVDLTGDNVTIEFDDAAKAAGFDDDKLLIEDGYFQITIPKDASQEGNYGIHIKIDSKCGAADTILHFPLPFSNDVIVQRYNSVLGLDTTVAKYNLSDFQWFRTSDSTAIAGQVSSNLNFYDLPASEFGDDSYYVCFTMNKGKDGEVTNCACAKTFGQGDKPDFGNDSTNLTITATYTLKGNVVFVNADWKGKTDVTCYAQWITTSGKVYNDLKFDLPDGGCTIPVPADNGLYLLRVRTDDKSRSFKFIINH